MLQFTKSLLISTTMKDISPMEKEFKKLGIAYPYGRRSDFVSLPDVSTFFLRPPKEMESKKFACAYNSRPPFSRIHFNK